MNFTKLSLVCILTLAGAALAGCVVIPMSGGRSSLTEVEVRGADHWSTSDKILIVECAGIISNSDSGMFVRQPSLLVQIIDQLQRAEKDPAIKGVLLRVDSPGGGVTASDVLYHEIKRLKEKREKMGQPIKVTVSMMGLAASGGYYISMAADKIYAHPTTITGSIGVIMTVPSFESLASKIGVGWRVFKSGENKDIGSMFREIEPHEKKILQDMIDDMYDQFIDAVAANRTGLSRAKILELADGRPYTAQQALDNGLIDGVMYLDQAIDATASLAGIKDANVVMYRYTKQHGDNIYARQPLPLPEAGAAPEASLIRIDADGLANRTPRFQYLYVP